MDNSDVSEILTRSHFSTPINQIGLAYSPLISVPYNTPEGYSRNQMMTPSIFQSPRLLSTFQSFQNLNLRQRVPFTPTLTNASRLVASSWRQVPEISSEQVSTPKISRDGVRFASSERVLLVPQLEVESESATQMEKSGMIRLFKNDFNQIKIINCLFAFIFPFQLANDSMGSNKKEKIDLFPIIQMSINPRKKDVSVI